VPAARRQPAEQAVAPRRLVQMKGLRIELRGKGLDLRSLDEPRLRAEFLADGKILE
jgi:hypothetical protein